MYRLLITAALAGAAVHALQVTVPAEASVMRAALEVARGDLHHAEPVHCRSGRKHHRGAWPDGCKRKQSAAPRRPSSAPSFRAFRPPRLANVPRRLDRERAEIYRNWRHYERREPPSLYRSYPSLRGSGSSSSGRWHW